MPEITDYAHVVHVPERMDGIYLFADHDDAKRFAAAIRVEGGDCVVTDAPVLDSDATDDLIEAEREDIDLDDESIPITARRWEHIRREYEAPNRFTAAYDGEQYVLVEVNNDGEHALTAHDEIADVLGWGSDIEHVAIGSWVPVVAYDMHSGKRIALTMPMTEAQKHLRRRAAARPLKDLTEEELGTLVTIGKLESLLRAPHAQHVGDLAELANSEFDYRVIDEAT